MNSEEIRKERERLKEERIRLSKKRKELAKLEKEQREKEIEERYSKSLIDTPITWISRANTLHFKNVLSSYVIIGPYTTGYDPERNPMNVEAPRVTGNITIVLPDTYVKFSGKVRVTIEPLSAEKIEVIE